MEINLQRRKKMSNFKRLEDYLEEIDHYLVVEKGGEEILSEIRSHIMEKAESEYGELTEESVGKTIAGYGSPRQVAEKYLEGYQLIAPSFKKHLFLYSGILFAVHYGFTILSFILGIHVQMFPFFFIPRMENVFDLIGLLPVTVVFDIGLVGIILYIITQEKKEVKLPWPKFSGKVPKKIGIKEPKLINLILMFFCFCGLLYIYFRFHSIFFFTFDFKDFQPLFNQPAATIYSLIVISVFAIEIIGYIIRFFRNDLTFRLILVKNGICLVIIWFIHNYPIESALAVSSNFKLKVLFLPFTWGLALIIVLDSLHVIYKIFRQKRAQVKQ
jgi:hypothetical protein